MKKISGFTLTEIIIAMAISSMVMLSGLSLYYISFKNSVDFQQKSKDKISFFQLLNRIQTEMQACQNVRYSNNTIHMEFPLFTSSYQFFKNKTIIISRQGTDTLNIDINNLTGKFNSIQIIEGRVDEVSLWINIGSIQNEIVIKKRYDAVGYLK